MFLPPCFLQKFRNLMFKPWIIREGTAPMYRWLGMTHTKSNHCRHGWHMRVDASGTYRILIDIRDASSCGTFKAKVDLLFITSFVTNSQPIILLLSLPLKPCSLIKKSLFFDLVETYLGYLFSLSIERSNLSESIDSIECSEEEPSAPSTDQTCSPRTTLLHLKHLEPFSSPIRGFAHKR